jgi:hypothetical protein
MGSAGIAENGASRMQGGVFCGAGAVGNLFGVLELYSELRTRAENTYIANENAAGQSSPVVLQVLPGQFDDHGLRRRVPLGLAALTALMYLNGCPQFADDEFEKSGKIQGNGDASGTKGSAGSVTGILIDGAGGAASSAGGGSTTDATGSSGEAGADASGVDASGGTAGGSTSSAGGSTSSAGGSTSSAGGSTNAAGGSTNAAVTSTTQGTGGTGGSATLPKEPTTLVYATNDNSVYAATWGGTTFDPPSLWDTLSEAIAFVEARYAPDRSWGLAAYQAEGDSGCTLWARRFKGTEAEPPLEISMGDAGSCLTARGFDIAFEQQSGRAMLLYAVAGGTLECRFIDSETMTQPQTIGGAQPTSTVNWVRAVPDFASDRVLVGYTAAGVSFDPLVVQEWDGSAFSDTHELATYGAILDAQSFDFAYYQGSLLAVRGDTGQYGMFSSVRDSDGNWSNEERSTSALDGNAQVVELTTLPYGVAGALYDADGGSANLGVLFWENGDFSEETSADISLPDISTFESPSLKIDVARLGDSAVMVYSDAYAGTGRSRTGLGWATKGPNSDWEVQSQALPIPHDQESRDAYTRSIRLARHEVGQEGLVLVFGEDDGLFESHLSDLQTGWSTPKLINADVQGSDSTPFSVAGPTP